MASTPQKTTLSSFTSQPTVEASSASVSREATSSSLVQDWSVASADQPVKNASVTSLIHPVDSIPDTSANPSSKGTTLFLYLSVMFVLLCFFSPFFWMILMLDCRCFIGFCYDVSASFVMSMKFNLCRQKNILSF